MDAINSISTQDQMRMQVTTPYLTVKSAADAITFYQKAFDAQENMRMPAEDGKRLMHACLSINGGAVMLSDEFPEYGATSAAPKPDQPSSVAVAISYGTPKEVDTIYQRAVGAGCKGTQEPHDAFFGARFAMLSDPFGHQWMLVAPLPQA